MIHGVKPLPGWQALPPSPPRERRAAVSLSPPKPVKLSEATRKRLTELQRAVDSNREEARRRRTAFQTVPRPTATHNPIKAGGQFVVMTPVRAHNRPEIAARRRLSSPTPPPAASESRKLSVSISLPELPRRQSYIDSVSEGIPQGRRESISPEEEKRGLLRRQRTASIAIANTEVVGAANTIQSAWKNSEGQKLWKKVNDLTKRGDANGKEGEREGRQPQRGGGQEVVRGES